MTVLFSIRERVLHVVLNRPEKRNALTVVMCTEIANAIADAQENREVGSIMISAAGKAFCSGMDLDEVREVDELSLGVAHEALFSIGAQSLKPILVSVNGTALGGGLGLVAQGHVVIASDGAMFGLPEIRIGLWPFVIYRSVESALGSRRTLELSLTGRTFSTQEAYSWGLVHRVCPGEEIVDRADAIARDLAKASPFALSAGMEYVRASTGKSWKETGELAAISRQKLMRSADFEEGCLAFKQRREARWPSMYSGVFGERPSE